MDLSEALQRAKAEASSKERAEAVKQAVEEQAEVPAAEQPKQEEPRAEKILIESYGDVRISKVPGEPLYFYEIPAPHYRGEEKALINTLLEIASGVIADEPGLSKKEKRQKYLEKILQIIEATPELRIPIHAKQFYAEAVVKEMAGFGVIDPLLDDDQLEEIMIIGPKKPLYIFHRKYEMMKTNIIFYEDKDIRNIVDKMGRTIGRRIDNQNPLLDARLPDGSRVNATIPPASIDGSTLTLRKFSKDPLTIVDLVNSNTLDLDVAALLWLVGDGLGARPANILVAGGTACGKTTTLNVLASFIPGDERIVSIEDTAELSMPLEHWIRLEVRPASVEGTGEISMDTLVKNSLRMRPDRVIVGEIRGAEGFTMFTAMNTGHNGTALAREPVHMSSGDILPFEKLFEQHLASGPVVKEEGFEYVDLAESALRPSVIALDAATMRSVHKPISRIWRRRSAPKESVFEARTDSGRTVRLSWDHPVFRLSKQGFLEQMHFNEIRQGDRIAVPKSPDSDPIDATAIVTKIRKALGLTLSELPAQAGLRDACKAMSENFNLQRTMLVEGFDFLESFPQDLAQNPARTCSKLIYLIKKLGAAIRGFEDSVNRNKKTLASYQCSRAKPTRSQANAMAQELERLINKRNLELTQVREHLLHLIALANGDVSFERVLSLEEVKPSEYQYDLTVDGAHTYLAGTNGGVFVHNCLGTVHSNSAKETLVRLGSPPISVSPVMLNALNFIIMQHRIHDRRKGVIRRMTEIAECLDGGETGPSLQLVFQWDAAKDRLVPTCTPIRFLQVIAEFSGLTAKDMEVELAERKRILEDLVKRGVRDQAGVCAVTQSYILKKRGKW